MYGQAQWVMILVASLLVSCAASGPAANLTVNRGTEPPRD